MNTLLFGILGYVVAQLAFGVVVARRISTEEDYLVAGRRLGPTVALFTIFATWFGAETCMGAAGRAYAGGLSETPAEPFGYAISLLLMGLVFAVPLWRLQMLTLADLFRRRFGSEAERISVLLMVPTSVLWAAAQVRAFGQILAAVSGLEVIAAITLAAFVVIVYTSMGGLLADAWSDLLQGVVLLLGLLVLGVMFLRDGGLEMLAALPTDRLSLGASTSSWWDFAEAWGVPVVGGLLAQEMVARVMASRSPQVARGATLGAATLYFAVGIIPVTLGLAAYGRIDVEHPEQILVAVGTTYLGPVLAVVFVGALVSAILSTVDSALLVAGSLTAHNLILPLDAGKMGERGKLLVNRAAVVTAGVIAYGIALASDSVYDLVQESSGFGAAGIVVAVAFGLFSGFGGAAAANTSMVSAFVVYAGGAYGGWIDYPFVWSMITATAV
ncbi:MAG: sodium:solute symporter [Acidobacteriota bacterium]|jgi:Na+/proline symporter